MADHPLAASQPPAPPAAPSSTAIDEATIRAIRRLPEMIALMREIARQEVRDDLLCHVGLCHASQCSRCGPILAVRKLVEYIDKGESG